MRIIQEDLGKGESESIALAMEQGDKLLVIDDLKARRVASQFNIQYTGSLGIILQAKESGVITEVKPVIQEIKSTNFRMTEELEFEIYKRAGE